jgi:MFS family permease
MTLEAVAERTERGPAARASLWRDRDFVLFFAGQSVSALGAVVSITALPLLVLQLTGSGVGMATAATLQALPPLFLGLLAGGIADRWDRRRVMIASDALRAILLALVPLAYFLKLPVLPVIYATAVPLGLLGVLFQTAFSAGLPQLVGPEQFARANSYTQAAGSGAWVVGPALAGVLSAWIGPGPTLLLDVATFLFSVATLALIRRSLRPQRATRETSFWRDIGAGVSLIARDGTLRALMALWGVYCVTLAPTIQALTFFVTIDRGLNAKNMGALVSGYGVGLFLGALLAGRLMVGRVGVRLLLATAAAGAGFVLYGALHSLPVIIAVSAAIGLCDGLVWVGYVSYRAQIVPGEFLGRVSSVSQTLAMGLSPLGLMAAGLALDRIGGSGTLVGMGVLLLAASGLFALSGALRGARV